MDQKVLQKLYKEQLEPQLIALERKRKWIVLLYCLTFVVCGIMVWVIVNGLMPLWPAFFVLIFIEVAIVSFINFFHSNYLSIFKGEVLGKIVSLVNKEYTFDHEKSISLETFNQSKIFPARAAYSIGDDYIEGKIGSTVFAFSELRAWQHTREIQKPGLLSILVRYVLALRRLQFYSPYRKNRDLIFKGLFFYADFNKHLSESTFVFPDIAEKLMGKSGQMLQRSGFHGKLVKLENPEFEKHFVVYSSSQQEARYVLTPLMMEAILNIRAKYRKKIHLSFTGDNVYLAFRFGRGLFEPRLFSSGVRFSDMVQMFDMIKLIETIINEMNLNTRIWTKE
jgi:hypothetical protein